MATECAIEVRTQCRLWVISRATVRANDQESAANYGSDYNHKDNFIVCNCNSVLTVLCCSVDPDVNIIERHVQLRSYVFDQFIFLCGINSCFVWYIYVSQLSFDRETIQHGHRLYRQPCNSSMFDGPADEFRRLVSHT